MPALLDVRDLHTGYGGKPVLGGVSFAIEEGTTTVLLGLNGAGKTTTVSTVAGLVRAWSGTVEFAGERVEQFHSARLVERGIVLVPEGRRVFPGLSVSANLHLGGWAQRKRRNALQDMEGRVYEYLPRLAERRDQLAGTLSGGEQQMLAIGRALMSLPRLMLIDEASLGLSPRLSTAVYEIIGQINADGVTVLMVEQNAAALRYAHHALVLEKGVITWRGPAGDLRHTGALRRTYLGTAQ
jgi:branched-chain amino acid transport system ATP-binding protein